MGYALDHRDEGERLEQQAELFAYNLVSEYENLNLKKGEKVLDAGCGTGLVARHLRSRFPDCHFDGCDASELRLQQAKTLSGGNLRFFSCDLGQIPEPDESYNVVLSRYVFEHLAAPLLVTKELYRLLKPGGLIHLVDFDGILFNLTHTNSKLQCFLDKLRTVWPSDLLIGRRLPVLLNQAGFKNVQWTSTAFGFQGSELDAEVDMTEKRLSFCHPLLVECLGSAEMADEFVSLYLGEMRSATSTLFYNKFIVTGVK